MKNFTTMNPTRLEFGRDKEKNIGQYMAPYGIKKTLIIYGSDRIKNNGLLEIATSSLKEAGIEYFEVGGVKSNPVVSKVREAVEIAKENEVDSILAIGGGSVLDSAKAVAAGALYDGDVWDLCNYTRGIDKALRIFDIMTVAATGSEMNGAAAISNEETNEKLGLFSIHTYPTVSIVNPVLQSSVPSQYLSYAATDIFAHCLDLYLSAEHLPNIMAGYIENILRTVVRTTTILLSDPTDYEARSEFAWAATCALNGSTFPGAEGYRHDMHTFEHSLSALYDVAHGAGLAVVMPAWFEWHRSQNPSRYNKLASEVFKCHERDIVDTFKKWLVEIDAPTNLTALGINTSEINSITSHIYNGLKRERLDNIYTITLVNEIVEKMK